MKNLFQSLALTNLGKALLLVALLLLAMPATPVHAQELNLRLDPEATRITFTLGATMHTVEGSAPLTAGELSVDLGTRTVSGTVTVEARALKTGNKGRDKKMHAEVLESEQFPEIVLTPERFEGTLAPTGTSQITVHGTLEVHGESHPVELPTKVSLEADQATARLTFSVPYVEWGMEDPSTFVLRVAKKVDVVVEAVATLEEVVDSEAAGDDTSDGGENEE